MPPLAEQKQIRIVAEVERRLSTLAALDAENLPNPDVIAEENAEDLRSALEQVADVLGDRQAGDGEVTQVKGVWDARAAAT